MPKNSRLPTNDQFRTDFPEFADKTRYPDPSVNFYLGQADSLLNQDVQGDQFVYLAELFTAHYNAWLDYLDALEAVDTSSAPAIEWPTPPAE